MNRKNCIKVRLYTPGTIGFEFYCAAFYTINGDNDAKHLIVNFDWEKELDGDYDRNFGAPEAVKMFMFLAETNNNDIEYRFNFDKPKIDASEFSKNGVIIKNIEHLNISVTS